MVGISRPQSTTFVRIVGTRERYFAGAVCEGDVDRLWVAFVSCHLQVVVEACAGYSRSGGSAQESVSGGVSYLDDHSGRARCRRRRVPTAQNATVLVVAVVVPLGMALLLQLGQFRRNTPEVLQP
jgi:hypothetical protein